MREAVRKLSRILVAAALLFILAGCGGELDTEMKLSEDQSGSRVMVYTANIADNEGYVTGEPLAITQAVKDGCPKELAFSSKVDDKEVVYTFTLSFSDLDDYRTKVEAVLTAGGRSLPADAVTYAAPDSVFARGMAYRENFSSSDLMEWFVNLMVNAGYVEASNRSSILNGTTVRFYYNDELVSEGTGSIGVNTIEYNTVRGVEFHTVPNPDGTFDRTVILDVPRATMDAVGDEVRAFIGEHEKTFSGSWNDSSDGSVYTLTGSGLSAEDVQKLTAEFTGVSAVFSAERAEGDGPLFVSGHVTEEFSLENYISGERGTVNFSYYTADAGRYTGKWQRRGSDTEFLIEGVGENGELKLFSSDDYSNKLSYDYRRGLELSTVNMNLKVKNGGLQRRVELEYLETLSDTAAAVWKERLENAMDGTVMSLESLGNADGVLKLVIVTDGTAAEENEAWKNVFGVSFDTAVMTSSKARFPRKITTAVTDIIDMSAFTDSNVHIVSYDIAGIGHIYGEDETVLKDVPPQQRLEFSFAGGRTGAVGTLLFLLPLLLLAAVIVRIVLALVKAIKEAWDTRDERKAARLVEREAKKAERQAEKEAEKEAKKAEKEAEKEARQAEKEAEKEAKKAEKEAEKEAKKAEKEAEKAATLAGDPGTDAPAPAAIVPPAETAAAPRLFCPECGQPLETPGSAFCGSCGAKIS